MNTESHVRKPRNLWIAYFFIVAIGGFIIVKALVSSLFFAQKSRVNLIFWDETPQYVSLDQKGKSNFLVNYYPDLKILVPGGFGYYRIGALGKLITLEKNPGILIKAFSSANSSTTNFYFYSGGEDIFFGDKSTDSPYPPNLKKILFYQSNANYFDRLYIALGFISIRKTDFQIVNNFPIIKRGGDTLLDEKEYSQKYSGFFYQSTYRDEKKTVQILYSKEFNSADLISRILEGNGVRVVDIDHDENGGCLIIEPNETFSKTGKDIADFLDCTLQKGKTSVSDIIIKLGNREKEWVVE